MMSKTISEVEYYPYYSNKPLKAGVTFLHRIIVDTAALQRGERVHVICRVTRVAMGQFWYALQDNDGNYRKAKGKADISAWDDICLEVLTIKFRHHL